MCIISKKLSQTTCLVVRHIDINSNFNYALNLSYYDGDMADMLNINMSVHRFNYCTHQNPQHNLPDLHFDVPAKIFCAFSKVS